MNNKICVTFGEIMGRLVPEDHYTIEQSMPGSLRSTFSGAEANVAVSLSHLGCKSRFVSSLPDNALSRACIADLKKHEVETSAINISDTGRMGLYFVERGTNQRPSKVIYDREGSAFTTAAPESYEWENILKHARSFHVTGITPGLSKNAAEVTRQALKHANSRNLLVTMDINFRSKLWNWDDSVSAKELARKVMRELIPYVDVLIGNEADAGDVLDIHAEGTEVESGILNIESYPDVGKKIGSMFPNLKKIAITLRQSISADHNNWGAMLYDVSTGNSSFAPLRNGQYDPWKITDIVDRVGAGDAFGAGLVRAMLDNTLKTDSEVVSFAVAASCLAHSVHGDYNPATYEDVYDLAFGRGGTGRVVR